ncbi:unnamed protein product [Spirodela intermedia]|uniref:Uncharacterized protein n=2 Tax=Spirodela intermedia TaxID=51605 RepID=A0A7I8L6E7_SPIIN|nr:unnamed protein product [Spirodela intermedia]
MRNKASVFLKQMLSLLVSIGKAKALAAKCKTSTAKTRLLVLGLFRNKKVLLSSLAHKIHILIGHEKNDGLPTVENEGSMAIPHSEGPATTQEAVAEEEEEEDDGYPDLRHSLFDGDDEFGGDDGTGSVIDLVKNARGEDQGEFVLEDEIDHVADMFIRRFHRQIMLQKMESFKRYQEMLERSV